MRLTIDSSVFVEALVPGNVNTKLCQAFLNKALKDYKNVELFEPALLSFEVCNATSRATNPQATASEKKQRTDKAKQIFDVLHSKRPNTTFIPIDDGLWGRWKLNIDGRSMENKTQDELFLFIAHENNSILITLDKAIKASCSAGPVEVLYPYEALIQP